MWNLIQTRPVGTTLSHMDGRTDMTNINGDIKMAGLQMMLSVLISPSILLANLNLCHFTISLSLEALRDFKKYPRLPLPSGYDAIFHGWAERKQRGCGTYWAGDRIGEMVRVVIDPPSQDPPDPSLLYLGLAFPVLLQSEERRPTGVAHSDVQSVLRLTKPLFVPHLIPLPRSRVSGKSIC